MSVRKSITLLTLLLSVSAAPFIAADVAGGFACRSQAERPRVGRMQPRRHSLGPPLDSAGKVPDLVEVAFEVGKDVFAFAFGDALFPREARRAERQHPSFERL